MNTFDPSTVRKAVAEFAPRRPQRFHDLAPAREVIVELRQKRASYRSIAELLTEHCLPISKTAIAAYCHEVLGERVRPKRRPTARKHGATQAPPAMSSEPPFPLPVANGNAEQPGETKENNAPRSRGPRIAQVRMLNQPEK
jgi:hypothetical protein